MTPFGLKPAKVPVFPTQLFRVAEGELLPIPHDLMWIDDNREARQISGKRLRESAADFTRSLNDKKVFLFVKWHNEPERIGLFAGLPEEGSAGIGAETANANGP